MAGGQSGNHYWRSKWDWRKRSASLLAKWGQGHSHRHPRMTLVESFVIKLDENAIYVNCDVSNEDDIRDLVDTATTKCGKLGIDGSLGSILTAEKSDLDKVIEVNLVGGFLGAKQAARVMVPARKGSILFTASACVSTAGLGSHAYIASKYAIVGLMKKLVAELGQYGIRVNSVSPYAVTTCIVKKIGSANARRAEATMGDIANLKETDISVDDVVNAALYLASEEANYVSGLDLVVAGGFSIVNPTFIKALNQFPR